MLTDQEYLYLEQQFNSNQIALTPSELHGFITGMICGRVPEDRWQSLLNDMYNDGHALPTQLMRTITDIRTRIQQQLKQNDAMDFPLWLDPRGIFPHAQSALYWSSTFMLGFALGQSEFETHGDQVQAAMQDLSRIAATQCVPNEDDPQEVQTIMADTIKYMQEIVAFLYHFYHSDIPSRTIH
ncbi:UPF0149 family protein [Spirabiliibacterium falconis]|uniref:UPF0149 family protein n=1 Tax=Spirabiliibacterium falconis TaxID=572023 RepID=UPI001AAD1BBC|nr:UPF0149 family protein [Spirabiliibacterium falconis]MBE2894827.1 UPF0149 family protein [Spirabiliibacterium falconis]